VSVVEHRPYNLPPGVERTEPVPAELSDEQRAQVIAFFKAHPEKGYKAACNHIGISRITKAEARRLLHDDDEIRRERFANYNLDEQRLLTRTGEIANDPNHKDQFRAIQFAFNVVHGWIERRAEEITGPDGRPLEVTNPDLTAALDRFTTTVNRLSERAQSGGAVRALDRGRAELAPPEPRG
jgi:hypothetical protein